jgi:hypothetical protein
VKRPRYFKGDEDPAPREPQHQHIRAMGIGSELGGQQATRVGSIAKKHHYCSTLQNAPSTVHVFRHTRDGRAFGLSQQPLVEEPCGRAAGDP